MLNDLLLLSGVDIPFPEAQVSIHQPTIKEIAYIGEETFFTGCELLNFSKENLNEEDKAHLNNQSNFDIIMSIMRKKNNINISQKIIGAKMVLMLLFPDYTVKIDQDKICLIKFSNIQITHEGQKKTVQKSEEFLIDNKNFDKFQIILKEMFCLKQSKDKTDYNPQGDLAKKIADKLRKGRQKVAAAQGQQEKVAIFSRYISILAVGEQKNLNELLQYTVYQLFDEFERFELKMSNDIYVQAKMAGAKDLEEIESWMKDLHS